MLDLHAADEVTSGLPRPYTCSAYKTDRLIINYEHIPNHKLSNLKIKWEKILLLFMSSDMWNIMSQYLGSFLSWRWRPRVHSNRWQVSTTLRHHLRRQCLRLAPSQTRTSKELNNICITSHTNVLWMFSSKLSTTHFTFTRRKPTAVHLNCGGGGRA
jgi:hypothetical protein